MSRPSTNCASKRISDAVREDVEEALFGPWQVRASETRLGPGATALVMGILNVTPDSFSDGGQHLGDAALRRALEMVEEGADIVDIGGESTRPGAAPVSIDEELARVLPAIRSLRAQSDTLISVDTRHAAVADAALSEGADIVNDVSGLHDDPEMAATVAKHEAALVVMHKRGEPQTMQNNTHYKNFWTEVVSVLESSLALAYDAGIHEERIVVDPGIGFGKGLQHNLSLVRDTWKLGVLGRPVLLGASRKSFLGLVTNRPVSERLGGSVAAATIGLMGGARILRVHDVAETVDAVKLVAAMSAIT